MLSLNGEKIILTLKSLQCLIIYQGSLNVSSYIYRSFCKYFLYINNLMADDVPKAEKRCCVF